MTVLLSHTLFDYCGKYELERDQYGSEICSTVEELPLEKIEPESLIVEEAGTCSFATLLQPSTEVSHHDFFTEVTSPGITDLNDSLHDIHDDVHLPASSGFILSEDNHFVTFGDNGACDWGVDMSLNSDF